MYLREISQKFIQISKYWNDLQRINLNDTHLLSISNEQSFSRILLNVNIF